MGINAVFVSRHTYHQWVVLLQSTDLDLTGLRLNHARCFCLSILSVQTSVWSRFRWFCHFDDDNYVNTARLSELLAGYSPQEDWYLGKNSIRTPLQIMDRAHNGVSTDANTSARVALLHWRV